MDTEEATYSLDRYMHEKYVKEGHNPFSTSERSRQQDFQPEVPAPQRPLAPFIEPPEQQAPALLPPNAIRVAEVPTQFTSGDSQHPSSRAADLDEQVVEYREAPLLGTGRGEVTVGVMEPPPTALPRDLSGTWLMHIPFAACSAMALAVLALIRLGRGAAEAERLDLTRRSVAELQDRRRASEARGRLTADESPEDTARRIAAAKQRAVAEKTERERKQAEYAATAAAEAQRAKAQQAEARRAYEEDEERKAEELQKRVARERALASERAQQRREAEGRQRRALEEAERLAEEERVRLEKQQRAEAEATARLQAAERAALASRQRVFSCTAAGHVAVAWAPRGLMTRGRLSVKATLQVEAEASSLLAGDVGPFVRGAAGIRDVEDVIMPVAAETAEALVRGQASAYQLQGGGGTGPLTLMDDVELKHWMHQLCMLLQVHAAAALRQAKTCFSNDPSMPASGEFSVRVERGVLPHGHERRSDAVLDALIVTIEEQGGAAYEQLAATLDMLFKDEERSFRAALTPECEAAVTCSFLLEISIAAYLVARTVANRPSKTMDAPAWYEATIALVSRWLSERMQGAAPDALIDTAEITATALGEDHPVAKHVAELTEQNMSLETKKGIMSRQRAIQAEIASQILKQELPSRAEMAAARAQENEAATPIPERVWALRNVAASLAMGAGGERRKAKEYYEKALQLQREHLGSEKHPGLLGELWRLVKLLVSDEDGYREALAYMMEILDIVGAVGQRYTSAGDLASACAVYEGTCFAFEGLLDPLDPALQYISKQAENVFSALNEDEKAKVLPLRRKVNAIEELASRFTEELEIYSNKVKFDWNAAWTADRPLLPFV